MISLAMDRPRILIVDDVNGRRLLTVANDF